MSAWMCPVLCRAGVGRHARRRRGGTLVEHAEEARRLSCGEGGRRHVQLCEQVPGLPLLGVAQPERISKWLTGVARRDPKTVRKELFNATSSFFIMGFCTRQVQCNRRRRRPEPGWRFGGSSLRLPRWFRRGGVSGRLGMLFSLTSSPGVVGRSECGRASLQGTSVLP